jgi:hypothetical protein
MDQMSFSWGYLAVILGAIEAPELGRCVYTVGRTPAGEYVYVWGPPQGCGGVPQILLTKPMISAGAIVGTQEEIIREINADNACYLDWGTRTEAEAYSEVVSYLLSRLTDTP